MRNSPEQIQAFLGHEAVTIRSKCDLPQTLIAKVLVSEDVAVRRAAEASTLLGQFGFDCVPEPIAPARVGHDVSAVLTYARNQYSVNDLRSLVGDGGENLFVDFAGVTIAVFDAANRQMRVAHIFVAALGAFRPPCGGRQDFRDLQRTAEAAVLGRDADPATAQIIVDPNVPSPDGLLLPTMAFL